MKNLAIGKKLMLAFGILAGALLVMAALSIASQARLNDATVDLGQKRRDKLIAISLINAAKSDYRIGEASTIIATDPAHIRAAVAYTDERAAAIDAQIAFLADKLNKPASRRAYLSFCDAWRAFLAQAAVTRQLAVENRNDEATASFRASTRLYDRAGDLARRLHSEQVKLMDAEMATAART